MTSLKGGHFYTITTPETRYQKIKSLKPKYKFLVANTRKNGKKNVIFRNNDDFDERSKTLQHLLYISLTIYPGTTDIRAIKIVR